MRRDRLYLADIVAAADAIAAFIKDVTEDAFYESELLQSAVLHQLMIVGEAAAQLDASIKEQNPDVPWRQIVQFRNIVVHSYFSVWLSLVWTAATEEVPVLRDGVRRILAAMEASEDGSDADVPSPQNKTTPALPRRKREE